MWRALVGSGRLGSDCLVLRADTRENPAGKNGVMIDIGGWTSQTCDLFFKLLNFSVGFFKKKRFLTWEAG